MIAHRLETAVTYCDYVCVMDEGRVVEKDKPYRLLANRVEDEEITNESKFTEMVRSLGEA